MTRFATRLRIKLEIPTDFLRKASSVQEDLEDVSADVGFANRFINYLFTVHSIIRSSVHLMQSSYEKCLYYKNDRLLKLLKEYYQKHIEEERNHDEWLLDDLEATGISRKQVLTRKPSVAVAELVGSQYYWIYHWHPVCLLGYIAVLEGYPPKKERIDFLQKKTGFPDPVFRTLIKHSYLDPNHKDDLDNTLNNLPLLQCHEEWITLNALYTADRLRWILRY